MATRLVLDTSVVISALIGRRGPSREVIRKCLQGTYNPLISNALFQEYEDVSKRTQVLNKCPLSQAEISELLHAIYSVCEWVPIYYLWRPNVKDEADNFLIELAIAGNAAAIVSNNVKDLKNAELSFPQLRIMKPEQLLRGE
jgi:putative PIN family toxin of toxin-antitoxin system